jgi:hypothetical protein
LAAHHLAAIRRRIDVAVPAGLVAELSDVDLEVFDAPSAQRPEARLRERVVERRHAREHRALLARARERQASRRQAPLAHIESFSARLRI